LPRGLAAFIPSLHGFVSRSGLSGGRYSASLRRKSVAN
jgi:hypothetical protein